MHRKLLVLLLTLGLLIPASSLLALEFPMPKPGKCLFPEPQEQVMRRMSRPADRIIYLYRCSLQAQADLEAKKNSGLNYYLAPALADYHRLATAIYALKLKQSPRKIEKFRRYWDKVLTRADRGAFHLLFPLLPAEMNQTLAREAAEATRYNERNQSSMGRNQYLEEIAEDPDYFRKIPFFLQPAADLADQLSQLVERIKRRFEPMYLMRAIHWAQSKLQLGSVAGLSRLQQRLSDEIYEDIEAGLRAQAETNLLKPKVATIHMAADNSGLMVGSILFQGAIRDFEKHYQKLRHRGERALFGPVFDRTQRLVSQLEREYSKDVTATKTLKQMTDSLKMIRLVVGRQPETTLSDDETALFKRIFNFLKKEDTERLVFQD